MNETPTPRERSAGMSRDAKIWMVLAIPIIGLLLLAIPSLVPPRMKAAKNTCPNQLRQIDGAKQQWALKHDKTTNDTPTEADVRRYIKNNVFPRCPDRGVYTIGRVGELPTCSIKEHCLPPP